MDVFSYKFGSEKASALNTYAVTKSGGGTGPRDRIDAGRGDLGSQGAPPPSPVASTASPNFDIHRSSSVVLQHNS